MSLLTMKDTGVGRVQGEVLSPLSHLACQPQTPFATVLDGVVVLDNPGAG